jgi:hypothetical protein
MKNTILIISFLILIGSPIDIVFADQPLTNEQIIVNTISESALSLIDSLNLRPSTATIKPLEGLDELAIDGFESALIQSGFVIENPEIIPGDSDYAFDVSFSAFDFKYSAGQSQGFLKKRFIKRQATGQLLVHVTGNGHNFVGFRNFEYSDEVNQSQLNYIASIRYNQLSPAAPGGGMVRYLEPLAVTATVGGLVYLFFINR